MRILLLFIIFTVSLDLISDYQLELRQNYYPFVEDCNFLFFVDVDSDEYDDIITVYDHEVVWIKNDNGEQYLESHVLITTDNVVDNAYVCESPLNEDLCLFLISGLEIRMYKLQSNQLVLLNIHILPDTHIISEVYILRESEEGLFTNCVVEENMIWTYLSNNNDQIIQIDSLGFSDSIFSSVIVNLDDDNDNEIVYSSSNGLFIGDLADSIYVEESLISDSTLFESITVEDISNDGVKEIIALKNGEVFLYSSTNGETYQFSGKIFQEYEFVNKLFVVDFIGDDADDIAIIQSDSVLTFIENNNNFYVESSRIVLEDQEAFRCFADMNNDNKQNPVLSDFDGAFLQYLSIVGSGETDRVFCAGSRFDMTKILYQPQNHDVYFLHSGRVIIADITDSVLDFNLKPFTSTDIVDFSVSDLDDNGTNDLVALLPTDNHHLSLVVEYDDDRLGLVRDDIVVASSASVKVSTCDIDSDNLMDIVLYNSDSEYISVFYNINGEFMGDREVIITGSASDKFSFADVDGNGLKDIVYYSSGASQSSSMNVCFNNDGISFSDPVLIDYFLQFQDMHIEDYNNDSIKDLLVLRNRRLYLRYGDRSENGFQEFDNFISVSDGFLNQLNTDYNDDTFPDIFNTTATDGYISISVLENNNYAASWDDYEISDMDFSNEQELVCTSGSPFDFCVFDSADGSISAGIISEFTESMGVEVLSDISAACYPNPFNPETTISYTIKKDCTVEINVYNIKGQRIKTLLDSFKAKGKHSLIWDGTDENEHRVSSGIYFYKISTNRSTLNGKMILIK